MGSGREFGGHSWAWGTILFYKKSSIELKRNKTHKMSVLVRCGTSSKRVDRKDFLPECNRKKIPHVFSTI